MESITIEASKGPLNPNAEEFKPSYISNPTPITFPFPLPPLPYVYYPPPPPPPQQPPMMVYFHHHHHILSPLPPFKSFPPFNFPKSDHIILPRADYGLGLITSPTSPSPPPTPPTTITTTAPPQLHRITRKSHNKSSDRFLWVEKKKRQLPALLNPDPNPAPLSVYPFGGSTSLMIRNIPVRICRRDLMKLLDEHCRHENEKLSLSPTDMSEPFSMFDFLYLPIDFKRKGNLGYAFVNFTTWQGASRLYNSWKGWNWGNCCFRTKKICELHPAKFQGAQLKKHFEGSKFECESDEYLPIKISPARDGNNGERTKLITVGTRIF